MRNGVVAAFFMAASYTLATERPISFGLVGGVPLTEAFLAVTNPARPDLSQRVLGYNSYSSGTRRYTLGPWAEFRLPHALGIQVGALYKRLGFSQTGASASPSSGLITLDRRVIADRWEFPVLVKYRFAAAPVRPFLCGGGALNRVTEVFERATVGQRGLFDSDIRYASSSSSSAGELQKKTTAGIVLGGGAEYKVGPLRIAPELRYTWWTSRNFNLQDPALLSSNRSQVEFLMSFGF